MLFNYHFFYPDETLYSWVMRYHATSTSLNVRQTMIELFGKNVNSKSFLNLDIDYLVNELSCDYTVDYILNHHSLFWMFRPFIHLESINYKHIEQICFGMSEQRQFKVGQSNQLKICPHCSKNDIKKFGESYFHTIHQVVGMLICPVHNVDLILVDSNTNQFINLKTIHKPISYKNVNDENTILSANLQRLYNSEFRNYDISNVIDRYRKALTAAGYYSVGGLLYSNTLINDFNNYYSMELLNLFGSRIDPKSNKNWIRTMLSGNKLVITHPIRHLLFIQFLFGGIDSFLNHQVVETNPFGDGPYPCLNRICPDYTKEVILSNEITYRNKTNKGLKTKADFVCPTCGMIYTKYENKDNYNRLHRDRIKDYGFFWDNLFIMNANKEYSLRKLERIMYCDKAILIKQAYRLNISDKLNTNRSINYKSLDNKGLIDKHKDSLRNLIKQKPDLKRKEMRNLLKQETKMVFKADPEWYELNMQPLSNNGNYYKNYWKQKDDGLSVNLIRYIDMELQANPTKIITMNQLRKNLYSNLNKVTLNKLPLVKGILIQKEVITE